VLFLVILEEYHNVKVLIQLRLKIVIPTSEPAIVDGSQVVHLSFNIIVVFVKVIIKAITLSDYNDNGG
jgi:hypothetical protein